jgi:hypothetical protein
MCDSNNAALKLRETSKAGWPESIEEASTLLSVRFNAVSVE